MPAASQSDLVLVLVLVLALPVSRFSVAALGYSAVLLVRGREGKGRGGNSGRNSGQKPQRRRQPTLNLPELRAL
jgi:hypothetical protein